MTADDVLLILVIREVGLRSTLAARLSFAGAEVMTAQGLHDPAITRTLRGRAVLVLDEPEIANRSDEWLEALFGDPHWHQVVVITPTADGADKADARPIRLSPTGAAQALANLLPGWRGVSAA